MDSLSELKPILVDRYEGWIAKGGSPNAPTRPPTTEALTREEIARRKRDEERATQAQEAAQKEAEWRMAETAKRQAEEQERRVQEESAWARQSQEVRQRELDAAKRLEAREAAEHERAARLRREEEARRGYSYSDEERKEDERRRRQAERRRDEHDGILRRQQEADIVARIARREIAASSYPNARNESDLLYRRSQEPEMPVRSGQPYPDAAPFHRASTPQPSRPPSSAQNRTAVPGSLIMPLESPMKYDDDTDAEDRKDDNQTWHRGKYVDRTPVKPSNLGVG